MGFEKNEYFLNSKFSEVQCKYFKSILNSFLNLFNSHLFFLTSGTTASSIQSLRWVALSKESFLASAQAVNQHLSSSKDDVWLQALPSFHVGGLGIWARSALSGAKVVTLSQWNCEEFCQKLQDHQVTLTSLVPTQIYDLVERSKICPRSLRAILVGGSSLSSSLYQRGRALGWPLLPTYGMTETCSQVATAHLRSLEDLEGDEKLLPPLEVLPHLHVEIGEGSRIEVTGLSLLTAYIGEVQGESRLIDPKKQGKFFSEDRGEVHTSEVQVLKILGRMGDFVKIGGEGVELSRLRAIFDEVKLELGVFEDLELLSVPDERLGNAIHLFCERKLSLEKTRSVMDQFNRRVLPFEKIRKVHHVSFIPRNSLGKLISSQLLELL